MSWLNETLKDWGPCGQQEDFFLWYHAIRLVEFHPSRDFAAQPLNNVAMQTKPNNLLDHVGSIVNLI